MATTKKQSRNKPPQLHMIHLTPKPAFLFTEGMETQLCFASFLFFPVSLEWSAWHVLVGKDLLPYAVDITVVAPSWEAVV